MLTDKDKNYISNGEGGFSLIEVIIAMLILSAITLIVTMNVQSPIAKVRDDAILQQMETTISLARVQTLNSEGNIGLNELHGTLFEERPRRLSFAEPDEVIYPGICPETEISVMLQNSLNTYSLSYGTCLVEPIASKRPLEWSEE